MTLETFPSSLLSMVAVGALLVDIALGWPSWLYQRVGHPVGLFARMINRLESFWNQPQLAGGARRALGVLAVLLLLAAAGGGAWLIQTGLVYFLGSWGWLAVAALAWPGLGVRSLHDHVVPVARALADGDLTGARCAVGKIVGRDPETLDAHGIARAAVESLAESFCDGVMAPLFWLAVGGLPGLWAYKALNTADSLIGHKEPRWREFGWAAARADDVANFVPARLAGILICVVAGRGWRVMWRDSGKHASPNAGWPEAAMAGALDLKLAGPVVYDGVRHPKPWIGSGRADLGSQDVFAALGLYRRACALLVVLTGGLAWLL